MSSHEMLGDPATSGIVEYRARILATDTFHFKKAKFEKI